MAFSKRDILVRCLDSTGGFQLLRRFPSWRGLLVLNYHRIGDARDQPWDPGLWSATPEDFEWQLNYLKRHFDVIGQADLASAVGDHKNRFVLVTFDDGYRDNYELAYPILKSCAVPALFFLATGFLDQPRIPWWDEIAWMLSQGHVSRLEGDDWLKSPIQCDRENRVQALRQLLRVYKQLPKEKTSAYIDFLATATKSGRSPQELAASMWMTWEMVREMHEGGMAFGGHTVNHPVLANLSLEDQQAEISECHERIAHELNAKPVSFSYPVGGPAAFSSETQSCVKNQGFLWAFSYHGGYTRAGHAYNSLALPRVPVESETTRSAFKAASALPQWFG